MSNLNSLLLLACLCIGTPFPALAQSENSACILSGDSATDLRTDTRINPLGLEPHHLHFSWRLENAAANQAGRYRWPVPNRRCARAESDLWDSGWQEGSDTTQIAYAGKPLNSGQTAWWHVRVKDQDGTESAWSEPARFEMGLLEEADWRDAEWIGSTGAMDEPEMAPREVMGDWIRGPEGVEVESYKLKFDLPDRPVVSAMAYWGTSKKGATAIAFLAGRSDLAAVKRVTSANRGYVDLAFDLGPGGANGLAGWLHVAGERCRGLLWHAGGIR